jgi:hypothetical protein
MIVINIRDIDKPFCWSSFSFFILLLSFSGMNRSKWSSSRQSFLQHDQTIFVYFWIHEPFVSWNGRARSRANESIHCLSRSLTLLFMLKKTMNINGHSLHDLHFTHEFMAPTCRA